MDTTATPIPFSYEIAGIVNGEQAALRLVGTVEHGLVRLEVEVTTGREALLWDPTVLALAAIDPVLLMSLDLGAVRGCTAPDVFRVETGLYDDGEKVEGRLVLSGYTRTDDGRLEVRAQIVEGRLSFEPLERVTRVGESMSMGVLPTDRDGAVATRVWSIETSRGRSYEAASVSRGGVVVNGVDAECRVLRVRWSESVENETSGRPGTIACDVTLNDASAP